jgi:hypothetical protein
MRVVNGLAIAAFALSALISLWIASALRLELVRARQRRHPSPVKPVDVPANWAHLEQRDYLPRIFTPRLVVASVAMGLAMGWPWVALLVIDSDAFFELWVDIWAWSRLPDWWLLSVVGSIAVSPIVVMLIMRGYLCPECRGRLDKWTSPTVALEGGTGRRVLLMCPSCQIVYQAPWHVWGTSK